MTAARALLGLVLTALLLACQETPVAVPLRSLKESGEVAFVCAGPDENGKLRGQPIDACPDFENGRNRLMGLVTQNALGEVAVLDISAGEVVDIEPTIPGFSFLPIGEQPVDIVSTPGGEATFVGVKAVGKEGIFALPTSCIGKPRGDDPTRDLSLWPACRLPTAPGDMAVLVDPPRADGTIRQSCGETAPGTEPDPPSASALCPADLRRELAPPGRRKLAVVLPDFGQIAIIDAQRLLDRPAGSFDNCEIEDWVSLQVDLPPTVPAQPLPEDLQREGCLPASIEPAPPDSFFPRPAGLAVSGSTMYVADLAAPVVHVLDISDPCALREEPPLLPVSFERRDRIVYTDRVAVSPVTSRGQRFVYAIDDREGTVMMFDVTPGTSQRTPLVRPGSPRNPFEPPDRLAFSARAKDVVFVSRDIPESDERGVALVGTHCDPDFLAAPPATRYRPTADLSAGASPAKLRGVFAFLLLSSGHVAVIDVDDFDAECRRPVEANAATQPDFRGCRSDRRSSGALVDPGFVFTTTGNPSEDAAPTVTNELSCGVVQPHRVRSAVYVVNRSDRGVRAPALRTFPRLTGEAGVLVTDQSEEGVKSPKILAIDFPNPEAPDTTLPAQVYVGTTLHINAEGAENRLDVDPTTAERLSLVLPLNDPRSYGAEEDVALTFEGAVMGERSVGRIVSQSGVVSLVDSDALFCVRGVEDEQLMRERAASMGVEESKHETFGDNHADYVQIRSALFHEEHDYWTAGGSQCGDGGGRDACEAHFGEVDDETLLPTRDFRIVEAHQDRLVIEPRFSADPEDRARQLELLSCCFPSLNRYVIRAGQQWVLRGTSSGFRHDVRRDGAGRCIRDCNPRRDFSRARAFEVTTDPNAGNLACGPDVVPRVPVSPIDNAQCVFENLGARFVVYRGTEPSERDMTFTWSVTGPFRPALANLTGTTANVLPQSLVFVPQVGQLAVTDAASLGFAFISLDTLGVNRRLHFF